MFKNLFKKQTSEKEFVRKFQYNITSELREYLNDGSVNIPTTFNHFQDLDSVYTACVYLAKFPELNKKRCLGKSEDEFNIVIHVLLDDYKDIFLCTHYMPFDSAFDNYTRMVEQLRKVIME